MKEVIIGGDVVAFTFHVFEEFIESGVIFVFDEIWFGDNDIAIFKIDKTVRTLEVEFDFLRVEEVKHRDIMFAKTEVLEGVSEFLGVDKKVGEDDH